MKAKHWIMLGAVNAALAIVAGAFGAHGLEDRVAPKLLSAFETGAQYHFYHALGLIAVGLTQSLRPSETGFGLIGWLMIAGIILFSGSLYLLALTGVTMLGAITPLGGLAWIVAWLRFAFAAASD